MKQGYRWVALFMAVGLVLSIWFCTQPHQSVSSIKVATQVGLTIVFGCLYYSCLDLWCRMRPCDEDETVFRGITLTGVSALVNILLRVFWPADEDIQIAGSAASLIMIIVVIIQLRRRILLRGR